MVGTFGNSGGAAQFGEPDRLRLRHPCRGRTTFHPARVVEMRVRPQVPQVLVTEDPRLGRATTGDRCPHLRGAVGGAGIEPIEALAARNVRLQTSPVVDRGPALEGIGMIKPIPLVGERHVVVDADEIDVGIGPERLEVKEPAGAMACSRSRATTMSRPSFLDAHRQPAHFGSSLRGVPKCRHVSWH